MNNEISEALDELRQQFGNEDIFKLVSKVEYNAAKGITRVTEYKGNEEVVTESNLEDVLKLILAN